MPVIKCMDGQCKNCRPTSRSRSLAGVDLQLLRSTIYIPALTCDQEFWIEAETMRLQIQAGEMSFFITVSGLSFRG